MKKRIWLSLLLVVVVVSLSALWFFTVYLMPASEIGFRIYLSENNALVISDSDILSYNRTSQEMTLTPESSEKVGKMGDNLYSFTGFVIRIDGEEIYRGIFRAPTMSAIPSPPEIAILFPSYPESYRVMRVFFPAFQPPSDYPTKNMKVFQHFERTGKLSH
jgi:hypothetical protein